MTRFVSILVLMAVSAVLCVAPVFGSQPAQTPAPAGPETIDRILAHIEDDIILLSEVRALAAYQRLVDGQSQSQDQLMNALIEQWIVRKEAEQARFPDPAAADINAEVMRLQGGASAADTFRQKLDAAGLTLSELRRIIGQQIYLERYLDYKFRLAVQVDEEAIAKYYEMELSPAVRAQGQMPPPLDEVRERIREVLVQRGIGERANTWFDETKSRLTIEITPPAAMEGKK
jgi:hypothetical protein